MIKENSAPIKRTETGECAVIVTRLCICTDSHTNTHARRCAYRTCDRSRNREKKREKERASEKERKKETEKERKSEGMREYDISPIRPRHKRAICNAIVREHQCGERKKWRKVEW